ETGVLSGRTIGNSSWMDLFLTSHSGPAHRVELRMSADDGPDKTATVRRRSAAAPGPARARTMKRCGAGPRYENGKQVTSVSVGSLVGRSTSTASGVTTAVETTTYVNSPVCVRTE